MSWIKSKRAVTRKPHKCAGCCREIPSGTMMWIVTSTDMGQILDSYWCAVCEAVMDEWHNEDRADVPEGMVKEGDPEAWEEVRQEVEGK